jgi:hypothetical protein
MLFISQVERKVLGSSFSRTAQIRQYSSIVYKTTVQSLSQAPQSF